MQELKMGFFEVEEMELEILLELMAAKGKIEESRLPENQLVPIDKVLPA